jgi:prepilin-type N-terminal cleavage/methylation domain-containing protein
MLASDPGEALLMPRRGHSLLESLVVLVIIGTLASMLVPAVQRARASADRTVCANNLRQIGLAIHAYADAHKQLPYARLCPAPWRNGNDPYCNALPSPDTYTGPNELWWAPYDNRSGTDITRTLPDYTPQGILLPFVDGTAKVFRCPEGDDTTPDSPTFGRTFQVSYAMNPQLGGRRFGGGVPRVLAFEHMGLPSCVSAAAHWDPWAAGPEVAAQRHSPRRHMGAGNLLGRDANVSVVGP